MIRRRKAALFGLILALILASLPGAASANTAAMHYECVSTGARGLGGGSYAAISANGRFVLFESLAADLAEGHLNDSWDAFLRDRQTSGIQRVSTRSGGEPVYNPGDYTSPPALSGSGRYVAFMSRSENLVNNDGNGLPDIFFHDRETRTTHLVSVGMNGEAGNGPSFNPAISADGRFVAFQSLSNNLVPEDTNDAMDIFVRDLQNGVTERVSLGERGAQGYDPNEYGYSSISISHNGRYVAFSYQHLPLNDQPPAFLPSVYIRDRHAQVTRTVAVGENPRLSSDGRYLVFTSPDPLTADDPNLDTDVYLFDQQSSRLERVSLPAAGFRPGLQEFRGVPDISADGRYVVFVASGGLADGASPDSFQVYLRDRRDATTSVISRALDGGPANDDAHSVSIASDGSALAFTSSATNLLPNDQNNASDVFVYTLPELIVQPGSGEFSQFLTMVTR